jgi:hypothetical protein
MKISRTRLKEIIKGVMTEESEYQTFFQNALDKAGKSIPSMSDEEKKAFFDKIDAAWNGKGEKNEELVGGQKKLDVDKDGDIGSDDLADLRAGKKTNEEKPGLWANIRAKKARGEAPAHKNSDAYKDAVAAGKKINKESVNEEELNWDTVHNVFVKFLVANTKILDKRVKDKDLNGVKGGLQSIIDGLTNAQRSLKLK